MKKNLLVLKKFLHLHSLTRKTDAQMAKLVDALCSGRSARKGVLVRIQFWARKTENRSRSGFSVFVY